MNINDLAAADEQDSSSQEQISEESNPQIDNKDEAPSSDTPTSEGTSVDQPEESIEDLRKQISDANERVEGMRKKLSEKKEDKTEKADEYDSLFDDDKSLDDDKRETLKGFTEIMKKNGLSKEQAEGVIKELSQKALDGQGEWKSQSRSELVAELGENAKELISNLDQFANSQVHKGEWSAEEKSSFNEMVYDAKSVKVMNKLLEGRVKPANLSSDGRDLSKKDSWDKVYSDTEHAYRLISEGDRTGGEKILREVEIAQRRLS